MKRPIDRYVDSLLRRRRPPRFAPTEDDISVARAAIDLAAAAPDAQRPREAFVEDLRRRLAERQDAPQTAPAVPEAHRIRGRRRFLTATALTATGAVAGVGIDQALVGSASTAADGKANQELTPTTGTWQTVAAATDLPEGTVLSFDVGAISGFVRRVSGRVQAVSAICTHQGCRLHIDPPNNQFACPCHGATFSLTGAPLTRPHGTTPLPALPRLPVRIDAGNVQVYAPNQT
ncbi:Rieske (2Fe-2S) domain protein [Catenulispora acidiphila DSM 44928]|uniref:Rieske (2Fe-2S) domain protein n=1 Tax=Catenulispora acidiphila (strain DSM 44928 / JCM 14897 / NBRC 102108 / NRRL B-24433 / ID139908) TaxID=479433 RepID=C7PXJ2_CATAD|nr:Rieske 2Fe-2S domain-containing protein [Catenulispora acidiphila]ACU71445.1 Rieske (2Fe-2S) domain protein [Catenulispora acidiphila DSM 44928]